MELKIDMDALAFAWEDPASDSTYYLDTDTGSIVMVRPDLEDVGELREEIELQPNRFLFIPKPKPNHVELDLSDFCFTLSDAKLKTILEMAMESPNKYAAVRSVLQKAPEEWERWEDWKKQSSRQRALRWLEAQDVKALPNQD